MRSRSDALPVISAGVNSKKGLTSASSRSRVAVLPTVYSQMNIPRRVERLVNRGFERLNGTSAMPCSCFSAVAPQKNPVRRWARQVENAAKR